MKNLLILEFSPVCNPLIDSEIHRIVSEIEASEVCEKNFAGYYSEESCRGCICRFTDECPNDPDMECIFSLLQESTDIICSKLTLQYVTNLLDEVGQQSLLYNKEIHVVNQRSKVEKG